MIKLFDKIEVDGLYFYYEGDELKIRQRHGRLTEDQMKEKRREYAKKYTKHKKDTDPNFKLTDSLRSRIRGAIKYQGTVKSKKTLELLGCTPQQARDHLEKQFTEGMSWSNHGEWHIDHIIPCISFDLTGPEQQKVCFHYTNLQPLWAFDNLSKGGSLDWNKMDNSND